MPEPLKDAEWPRDEILIQRQTEGDEVRQPC
jgi:hypothetical protein